VSLCVYKESKTTPTARYFDREIFILLRDSLGRTLTRTTNTIQPKNQTLQQQGYLIKVRSRHGLNRNVVKRYSSLRKLHHMLKERFPTRQIPPFPPKCWFSNTSTTFLKQRRFDLEHYLQQLATNVGIMRLHEVIEFWETNDVNSEQHQVVIFGEIPEEEGGGPGLEGFGTEG